MEGISSFRNEIEIPFIFNVNRNGQRTTDFWYAFSPADTQRNAEFIIHS
jgi:hypothetical protein